MRKHVPGDELSKHMGQAAWIMLKLIALPVRRGNSYDIREMERHINMASWRAHELR